MSTKEPPLPAQLSLTPIGVIHTPFTERVMAPRQGVAAKEIEGMLTLFPGRDFEHALEDLEGWEMVWVIYWFHHNDNWRPKVLPPRSEGKRKGVFSTRSPHRPNPIGMSAVKLLSITGLDVRVSGVDMLDGTPLLDLKPYVPYADAFPHARTGWLDPATTSQGETPADPRPEYVVTFSQRTNLQLDFLRSKGIDLTPSLTRALALGPQPHAYRRIRREGDHNVLALKEWRAVFTSADRAITVTELRSGYRPSQLYAFPVEESLSLHREFSDAFGAAPPKKETK